MLRPLGILWLVILAGCAGAPTSQFELVFPPPPEDPRFVWEKGIHGSTDVTPLTAADRLKAMLTGEARSGVGFAKPFSVTVHQGRVFVSDTVLRRVFAFDFPESKFFEVGVEGQGQLRKPFALDTDKTGNLYVIDGTDKRVVVYDRDGNFLRTFGGSQHLVRPSGITVTDDGSRVFVVDTGGVDSQNHRVVSFNGQTGEHIAYLGTRGSEPGQFNLPREIALGPDGNLYIVDGGNFRIQVLTQDGNVVRTFGGIGRQFGQFSRPKGIAVDREGNIYVVDTAFGNFQIFSPEGQLLMFIGERTDDHRPGAAKYILPAGIDIDEDGRVYVVEQFHRRVDVFRPARLKETDGFLARVDQSKSKDKATKAAAPAASPAAQAERARQADEVEKD